MASSSKPLVVGSDGTLGSLLVSRLGYEGLRLRSPDAIPRDHVADIARTEVVINAAGPRVRPELEWSDYFREHVGVATTIARSMAEGSHLIQLSSTSVFGARGDYVPTSSVEAPLRFPNPAYAAAKLASEFAIRAICKERDIQLTILRLSMVYGPATDSALATLVRYAKRGIQLYLAPASIRQHLLHEDLLTAVLRKITDSTRPKANRKSDPSRSTLLTVADPFVLTNGEISNALSAKYPAKVRIPIPLTAAKFALKRWPNFPGREPPPSLAALGVLGLDNEFDFRPTFSTLGLDPADFSKEKAFQSYDDGS